MQIISKRFISLLTLFAFPWCLVAEDDKKEAKAEEKKKPDPIKIAHFQLSGSLGESPKASDPLFGGSSENFKDKLERLNKAASDKSVKGVYLHLNGLGIGWGKLNELTQTLKKIKKANKKLVAYLEAGSTQDYLVGLSCDHVCMPASGSLMLTGMRMEIQFFKELFDKLDIKADMLQMGDYKGAGEPYTRTEMSPALREQLSGFLDDMYEHSLVQAIVDGRKGKKWTADRVKKIIDNGPYTAPAALKLGLIDKLIYDDEVQSLLKQTIKSEDIEVVKEYGKKKSDELDLSNPFAILKLLSPPKKKVSKNPKIALIYAVGVINTGKSGMSFLSGESVGSTTMVKAIRQAAKDDTVKAIVLRVDSPGGSALASDLIWNALKKCKKPVIASMGDTAASGGYYISMAAEKIYAEPGTLTGSIGVIGGKIAIDGLFQKVGITSDSISRGKNAGILSSGKPFTPSQRKSMRAMMQEIYDQFLSKALEGRKKAGRKMTLDQLKGLAGGRIWTGRQALKNGLIDKLGTLEDAIADAKKRGGLKDGDKTELLILPKPRSILDTLAEGIPGLKITSESTLLQKTAKQFRSLEGLLRLGHEPVWTLLPMRIELK